MSAFKTLRTVLLAGVALSIVLPPVAQAQTGVQAKIAGLDNDSPERLPAQKPVPGSLEAGIWAETAKVEHDARTSGERDNDPALQAYVDGVLTRISGPFSGDVRLYVMDRPFFNASMAATGYTEVWTGLLLRCDTEDDLAFVLGHESGHFRHSHVMRQYQAMKNGQNAALAASILISAVALGASLNANSYSAIRDINNVTSGLVNLTYLGTIAALMNYSRDMETQADAYGLIYAREAGYYTGGAADLWRERLNETAASDYEKVRRSPSRSNVFGNHPLEADRIAALSALDTTLNGGTASSRTVDAHKAARAAYRDHIRPWLGAWLKDDLRRQDYGQTLYIIGRLSRDGLDLGVLDFYKGEALRLRGKRGPDGSDMENAITAYKAALESPDAPKETWRQLGDVYRHFGDTAAALDAFKHYIALAPDAQDAWMVQDQIDTLSKDLRPTPDIQPAEAPATMPTQVQTTPAEAAPTTTSSGGST
jgi:predicted Zn-dependent protease